MLSNMNAWWPSIIAGVLGLAGAFSPQIQNMIDTHPGLTALLAAIGAILTHILPSPVGPPRGAA